MRVVIELEENEKYRELLRMLCATKEGTCPGARNFGLSQDFLDMPPDLAQNTLAIDVIEKAEIFIPQITIEEVSYTNENGTFIPVIKATLNDEYEEEEGEDD